MACGCDTAGHGRPSRSSAERLRGSRVELVGFPRRKAQRHIGRRRRLTMKFSPPLRIATDGVVAGFVTPPAQLLGAEFICCSRAECFSHFTKIHSGKRTRLTSSAWRKNLNGWPSPLSVVSSAARRPSCAAEIRARPVICGQTHEPLSSLSKRPSCRMRKILFEKDPNQTQLFLVFPIYRCFPLWQMV